MKAIHLDAVGGIAGDMFVAAMLDAFPDLKPRVLADAAAVLPQAAGRVGLEEGESGGIRALRFRLETAKAPQPRRLEPAHPGHDHPGHHGHGGHHRHGDCDHGGGASPVAEPDHRHAADAGTFVDMVARIEHAALHEGTARHAVAILTIIAEAEATIHSVPVEEVHFHEIADWDSLLDVVAAGSIAAALDGAAWTVSPLPRGGGLVRTAHGLLPIPAPATAMILEGFDWRDDGISGERVTPTGAAILKHLDPAARGAGGRLVASGTGAGTRRLPGMPNILRAMVFEAPPDLAKDEVTSDHVAVIEFEIDDMTGEEIGVAAERLRATPGVLDLSIGQRLGKKGRPVSSFRLLARPEAAQSVANRCFAQTATIGLRLREERRLVLRRDADISAGVAVKRVGRPGGSTAKAESDALTGDTLAERRAQKRRGENGDD
jgi:hypothetical protein